MYDTMYDTAERGAAAGIVDTNCQIDISEFSIEALRIYLEVAPT